MRIKCLKNKHLTPLGLLMKRILQSRREKGALTVILNQDLDPTSVCSCAAIVSEDEAEPTIVLAK